MTRSKILLLPYHGNEPYLLGIRLALAAGVEQICLPLYYGSYQVSNQLRIISTEFPRDLHKIFLSKELGNTLYPLLRGNHDNRDFFQYASALSHPFNNPLISQVERHYRNLLANGITCKNLIGESLLVKGDFDLCINVGLPMQSSIEPTIYAFTALMSAVYSNPVPGDPSSAECQEKLASFIHHWEHLENNFAERIIPRIHALSHLDLNWDSIVWTPPLTQKYPPSDSHLRKLAALVIPSGTGLDRAHIRRMFQDFPTRFQLVAFSHFSNEHSLHIVPPTVYSDPKLAVVLSRGGWGTIWKCLVHEKAIGLFPTRFSEDPEIAHTQYFLTQSKMGFSLSALNWNDLEEGLFERSRQQIQAAMAVDRCTSLAEGSPPNGIDAASTVIRSYLPS